MKIAVYHQHVDQAAGGAEQVVVVTAEALSRHHQVDILHHKPGMTPAQLELAYGADLSRVRLRFVPAVYGESPWTTPWKRYRVERGRYREVTREYDLLLASVHDLPPFCHAPRGALFIHFPYFDRYTSWPWADDGTGLRKRIRREYARWEWKKRFEGYQVVMVNSEFTREFTRRWWGLESLVLYAPAKCDFVRRPKRNSVLSVGRFATRGTGKKQLELVKAFCRISTNGLRDWDYQSVGGLSPVEEDRTYFESVRSAGLSCGARVSANLSRAELDLLYEGAKIFWHAAGLGEREENPVLLEHFGIVTVEAMAAGCVPVVLARGGQSEIVEHGVNGYLWNRLEELEQYTLALARDPVLWARMSEAARQRAQHFSKRAYEERLMAALAPLLR